MKKLVIPIEESKEENSIISDHFGRSPLFAIVEVSDNSISSIKMVKNVGEHFGGQGGTCSPVTSIINQNPDALITKGMGPRALQILQEKGIAVFATECNTIKEAIESYKNGGLVNLTEPCEESRHHQ